MSTATASSAARPLPLRMRADLEVREQRHQGRTWWVVKEPIGLGYARLRDEEREDLLEQGLFGDVRQGPPHRDHHLTSLGRRPGHRHGSVCSAPVTTGAPDHGAVPRP